MLIDITPPQLHIHLEELLSAGMLATSTVGEPGTQGAAVTGIQGCGVSTPNAAAVAAATMGLAMELQTPKGRMFNIGLLSMILAIGIEVRTRLAGSTMRLLGAAPKLHCKAAPPHTIFPIDSPLL
jgi:hypothetical protein